jgi:uncharacterized sporulation protein YeaH/YhbH (DUF444 family)
MDQEPSVRAMVGTYIKDMSAVLQPADTGDRYDQYKKKMKDQPRIIVFFVTDNAASHKVNNSKRYFCPISHFLLRRYIRSFHFSCFS